MIEICLPSVEEVNRAIKEFLLIEHESQHGYIYCITNTLTNKKYIGQTKSCKKVNGKLVVKDPIERFNQHFTKAFNDKSKDDCAKFYEAIRQYPKATSKEYFNFSILEKCLLTDINKRERYYIKTYNTKKDGYNIHRGGKKIPRGARKNYRRS